jgi:hypothetical protein
MVNNIMICSIRCISGHCKVALNAEFENKILPAIQMSAYFACRHLWVNFTESFSMFSTQTSKFSLSQCLQLHFFFASKLSFRLILE